MAAALAVIAGGNSQVISASATPDPGIKGHEAAALLPSSESWVCYFSGDISAVRYRFNSSVTTQYKNVTASARNKWNDRATNVKFSETTDLSAQNLGVHVVNQSYTVYWAWVAYSADPTDVGDCLSNPHLWINSKTHGCFNDYTMSSYPDSDKAIIAAHELGHALGLGHPPDQLDCTAANPRPSIMYRGEVKFALCQIPRARDVANVNTLYW